jgi:hypothetical protein
MDFCLLPTKKPKLRQKRQLKHSKVIEKGTMNFSSLVKKRNEGAIM